MARPRERFGGTRWAIGLLVVSQAAWFAGCATAPKPILLQHPGTGHTVECSGASQDCMAEYQLRGYVSAYR